MAGDESFEEYSTTKHYFIKNTNSDFCTETTGNFLPLWKI